MRKVECQSKKASVPCSHRVEIVTTSLFATLPWPGDKERTLRSSNQAVTGLPHTVEVSHCPLSF